MERKHNPKQFKGKKKGTNEKKPKDNRFKKDARFHHLNRKEKTKLDDRFASVLKGSEFRDGGKLDKYGRKIGGDKDIEELSENELEQMIENENVGDDVEVYMDQGVMEAFEEQEKENIPRGGSTNQIAIMNCDWESTTAKELYVLLSACLPTGGKLVKIEIRPSKFGMERMAQEEVEGLPKNLWRDDVRDMVNVIEDEKLLDDNYIPVFSVISDADLAKPNPKLVVEEREIDEMEEEDDDNDLGLKPVTKGITPSKEEMVEVDLLDKEKVVSYEQEKHKYYFGVAVFDSIETADAVYSAIDGEELEFAPESLDLRFIPDGTEFPYEPIDVCDKYGKIVSRDGKAKSNKIKITWDSTDERRKLALGKKWNELDDEELLRDEELYNEFMEHDSDYEDDDAKEKKENADAVRKKYAVLLGEATGDENVNEDGDMMMTYTTESTEVKKTKKDKKDKEEEERNKAELELLLMDDINENEKKKAPRRINNDDVVVKKKGGKKSKKDKMDKNFQVDLSDDRFTPVLDSHDFDVDPSNPEYVATRGMKQILKEKHKRFEKKMRNKKQTK